MIITPVLKDFYSFNAVAFLGPKLETETDKLSNWYVTINGYNRSYEEAAEFKPRRNRTYKKQNRGRF
ncbi:MAG: hypothetical protein LBD86_02715 [Spirochaetaceae bacterium]|nr:hypothetical protein [Spirochaetaceae bacterium]